MRHPIFLAAGLLMAAPAFGQDGNATNGRGFMIEAPKLGFSVEVPVTTEWLARSASGADVLEATITVETDGSPTPAMLGRTNLPDRTELAVTLRGSASGYLAQARLTVESGRFKTKPFSRDGQALLAGDYEVEVLMPLPIAQPESVRKVLGAKGESLKGPLIEKSWLGNLVRHSFTINVAGPVSPELDR